MAVIENKFVCDLSSPVQAQVLKGNVFSLDNFGSRISVLVYNNGQPATISGTITANCILPDGSTVNVNGTLTTENGGSKAYVDIPQGCLLIPGILKIAVKCTSSSVITTLAAIVANVYVTKTDNVITPSQQIIDDWNAEISAAIAAQDAEISAQGTKIDELESALNAVTAFNILDNAVWEQNYYYDKSSGAKTYHSNYKCTMLSAYPNKWIHIDGTSSQITVFFDKSGNRLGGESTKWDILTPAGTCYIGFSVPKVDTSAVVYYSELFSSDAYIETIGGYGHDLLDGVSYNYNRSYSYTRSYATYSGFNLSELIDLQGYDVIEYSAFLLNNTGSSLSVVPLVLYASDGTTIITTVTDDMVQNLVELVSTQYKATGRMTIPYNARYARINNYPGSGIVPVLKGYKKSENVIPNADTVSDLKDGLNYKYNSAIYLGMKGTKEGDLTGNNMLTVPFSIDDGIVPLLVFNAANSVQTVYVCGISSEKKRITFVHPVTLDTDDPTSVLLYEKQIHEVNYLGFYSPNGGVQYYATTDASLSFDGYMTLPGVPKVGDVVTLTNASGNRWNGNIIGMKLGYSIKYNPNVNPDDQIYSIVVAQDGTGDYETIQDAVDSVPEGSVLHLKIMEGEYVESINLYSKFSGVVIEGVARDRCIISSKDGYYASCPLWINGNFEIRNITLKMTCETSWTPTYNTSDVFNTFPGYALHVDSYSRDGTVPNYGLVENCVLYSTCYPAIGMGLHKDQTVEVRNCIIERKTQSDIYKYGDAWKGAFLCHDANVANNPRQHLKLFNNFIRCNFGQSATIKADLGDPTTFTFTAVGNVLFSDENGFDSVQYLKSTSILDAASYGNSASDFNAPTT